MNPGRPMLQKLRLLSSRDDGLETLEYAIIAGLIVAAVILTITAVGNWVEGVFTQLKTDIGA